MLFLSFLKHNQTQQAWTLKQGHITGCACDQPVWFQKVTKSHIVSFSNHETCMQGNAAGAAVVIECTSNRPRGWALQKFCHTILGKNAWVKKIQTLKTKSVIVHRVRQSPNFAAYIYSCVENTWCVGQWPTVLNSWLLVSFLAITQRKFQPESLEEKSDKRVISERPPGFFKIFCCMNLEQKMWSESFWLSLWGRRPPPHPTTNPGSAPGCQVLLPGPESCYHLFPPVVMANKSLIVHSYKN